MNILFWISLSLLVFMITIEIINTITNKHVMVRICSFLIAASQATILIYLILTYKER